MIRCFTSKNNFPKIFIFGSLGQITMCGLWAPKIRFGSYSDEKLSF